MNFTNLLPILGTLFEKTASGAIQPSQAMGEVITHVQTLTQEIANIRADIDALKSGGSVAAVASDAAKTVTTVADTAAAVDPALAPADAAIDSIVEIVQSLLPALAALKSAPPSK